MSRFRTPALAALWLQALSVFGLCAFTLWEGQFSWSAWLSGLEAFLSGLTLIWWTQLFALVTLRRSVPKTSGTGQALAVIYPVLTAVRLTLWGMTVLALLVGAAPEANPVALTALVTIWGGAIWAGNSVNAGMLRLASSRAETAAPYAQQLTDWLNVSAALALGMLVLNAVPIKGFSSAPPLTSQLIYGLGGVIEIAATLLALLTLHLGRAAFKE